MTLATAMYSALSGHAVRSDLAMTGELSLRGRVLPIGGLKEKILAARQKGIQEVLVPDLNRPDVEKLPDHVTEGMDIRLCNISTRCGKKPSSVSHNRKEGYHGD